MWSRATVDEYKWLTSVLFQNLLFLVRSCLRFNSVWTKQFCFLERNLYFLSLKALEIALKMTSRCRQNYDPSSEAEVNKQINLELYASYVYLSMVRNNID